MGELVMALIAVPAALIAIYAIFYWLFIVPMERQRIVSTDEESARIHLDAPLVRDFTQEVA